MEASMQKIAITGVLCVFVAGCTVGAPNTTRRHPDRPRLQRGAHLRRRRPRPPRSPPQPDDGQWTVAQPADAKIRGDWWTIFNDTELNDLEGQLNINNQNIKVSFENYMEARRPWCGKPARSTSRLSASGRPTAVPNPPPTLAARRTPNTGQTARSIPLPLDISWTPDLFGRIRNQVREQQYAAQVSAADLENERLVEQADLATYFFEIRGQDALIKLYQQTVAAYQASVNLTQAQYDTGVGDKISLVEAQTTLETAQASLTNLGILRAQYEHAIAMLIGRQASGFSLPTREIATAPPPIPIGMPSLLLQRPPRRGRG